MLIRIECYSQFTNRFSRFPLPLRGCRNDDRCNFLFAHLTDLTRLWDEPFNANLLSVFRFVAIKYAIRFKYLDRDLTFERFLLAESEH